MNFFQAILLGIIQGITEFLPVSSSAHLVLFPYLMGWKIPLDQNFTFDVIVQLGTLLSLIVYFKNDIWQILKSVMEGIAKRKPFEKEESRLGWYVVLATIPAGLAGLLLKSKVEQAFSSPFLTSFFLLGTAFLLIIAEALGKKTCALSDLKWKNALWIGLFQAASIFPGISRSGSCISGGMLQNFKRKDAARFGFIMAIPIMLAAGLASTLDLVKINQLQKFLPVVLIGSAVAAVVGYIVIGLMLKFLNDHSLYPFAVYCVLLGLLVIIFYFLTPAMPVVASSQNERDIVKVELPSTLSWIIPTINQCNQKVLRASLLFQNPSESSADKMILNIGTFNTSERKLFILFQETINLVINKSNPLNKIHASQVFEIYSGNLYSWQQLATTCPDCIEKKDIESLSRNPIQIWVFVPGSTSQKIIETVILNNEVVSPSANIAPDERAMAEAIAINPSAIGFLSSHWINDQLKTIPILDLPTNPLTSPILVSIESGEIQEFEPLVTCIQSELT
jgi:undecaprenyl-diphosphatase